MHVCLNNVNRLFQNYWFESPLGKLLTVSHLLPHILRRSIQAAISNHNLVESALKGGMRCTAPEYDIACLGRAAASNLWRLTVEQFCALTILYVHSACWGPIHAKRTKLESEKWRAIFACSSLTEMRRLWLPFATQVMISPLILSVHDKLS